jgi:hypothetical protein
MVGLELRLREIELDSISIGSTDELHHIVEPVTNVQTSRSTYSAVPVVFAFLSHSCQSNCWHLKVS